MGQNNGGKVKSKREIKLKHPIPYSKGSLKYHLDILRAYVAKSKEGTEPVSYKDLEPLVISIWVSGNNKFFENLGLIRKEESGKYLPTESAIELSNYLRLGEEAKIKLILRNTVLNSWFWNSTKELLDAKDSVNRRELINKLCYDSGADPEKDDQSLNTIIEYMTYSDLLEEKEGNFKLKEPVKASLIEETEEEKVTEKELIVKSGRTEFSVFIGLLITPEMSEEQIRKAVRTIFDEIRKAEEEG